MKKPTKKRPKKKVHVYREPEVRAAEEKLRERLSNAWWQDSPEKRDRDNKLTQLTHMMRSLVDAERLEAFEAGKRSGIPERNHLIDEIYTKIVHGDEAHRSWLNKALSEFKVAP